MNRWKALAVLALALSAGCSGDPTGVAPTAPTAPTAQYMYATDNPPGSSGGGGGGWCPNPADCWFGPGPNPYPAPQPPGPCYFVSGMIVCQF